MRIDTAEKGHQQVRQALDTFRYVEAGGGRTSPARLRLGAGTDEWSFTRSAGHWRWSYFSTYGNGGFVHGDACDASGFLVTDPVLTSRLNTRWDVHVRDEVAR
jgi:hypothetical protein